VSRIARTHIELTAGYNALRIVSTPSVVKLNLRLDIGGLPL
jgi:hypothetical protein